MKGKNLGEFEEVILLIIATLDNRAYSVAIVDQLSKQAKRGAKLGVVHAMLNRLEKKGYLNSQLGDPTALRGGKRKRFYSLTAAGFGAIHKSRELRQNLWNAIPSLVLDNFR